MCAGEQKSRAPRRGQVPSSCAPRIAHGSAAPPTAPRCHGARCRQRPTKRVASRLRLLRHQRRPPPLLLVLLPLPLLPLPRRLLHHPSLPRVSLHPPRPPRPPHPPRPPRPPRVPFLDGAGRAGPGAPRTGASNSTTPASASGGVQRAAPVARGLSTKSTRPTAAAPPRSQRRPCIRRPPSPWRSLCPPPSRVGGAGTFRELKLQLKLQQLLRQTPPPCEEGSSRE